MAQTIQPPRYMSSFFFFYLSRLVSSPSNFTASSHRLSTPLYLSSPLFLLKCGTNQHPASSQRPSTSLYLSSPLVLLKHRTTYPFSPLRMSLSLSLLPSHPSRVLLFIPPLFSSLSSIAQTIQPHLTVFKPLYISLLLSSYSLSLSALPRSSTQYQPP